MSPIPIAHIPQCLHWILLGQKEFIFYLNVEWTSYRDALHHVHQRIWFWRETVDIIMHRCTNFWIKNSVRLHERIICYQYIMDTTWGAKVHNAALMRCKQNTMKGVLLSSYLISLFIWCILNLLVMQKDHTLK